MLRALVRACGLAALTLLAPLARAHEPARATWLADFDAVWTTVRDNHWDAAKVGPAWEAKRDELRPRVERAATRGEALAVINELLASLDQSHFGVVGASSDLEAMAGAGGVGIEPRVIDGRAIVFRVHEGSEAQKKGVRPGWEIVSVGGVELAPRLRRVADSLPPQAPHAGLSINRVALRHLTGDVGDELKIVFLDGQDRRVPITLPLRQPPRMTAAFGNLPAMPLWITSRRPGVPGGGEAVVFYFSIFADPGAVMPELERAVRGAKGARGFILDLRGNPGGIGAMGMGVGGWFVGEKGLILGTMRTKSGELRFFLNPRLGRFEGPLAVLVDESSASTSEIVAQGLSDIGRARVFGVATAGAALPSVMSTLPSGELFQYAIASYASFRGVELEGRGVHVDEEVPLTREALLAGKDPVIEAALAWIAAQPAAKPEPANNAQPAVHP